MHRMFFDGIAGCIVVLIFKIIGCGGPVYVFMGFLVKIETNPILHFTVPLTGAHEQNNSQH